MSFQTLRPEVFRSRSNGSRRRDEYVPRPESLARLSTRAIETFLLLEFFHHWDLRQRRLLPPCGHQTDGTECPDTTFS